MISVSFDLIKNKHLLFDVNQSPYHHLSDDIITATVISLHLTMTIKTRTKEIIYGVIEDDMEIGIKIHFGVFLNEEGSQGMKTVLH